MVKVFNKVEDLVNSMIKINSSWIKITDEKLKKLPISCKYFLTVMDMKNDKITEFFEYLSDETRMIEYPFVKENDIDYSMMLEMEQFYNLDLNNKDTIKDISNNIDEFLQIVSESNGKIVFVLDIDHLINFLVKTKNQSIPNHLLDMILFKLSTHDNSPISEILILDKNNTVKNNNNLLFIQLKMLMKENILEMEKDNKDLIIYKNINDGLTDNTYWNVLTPKIKITEHICQVQSPINGEYFNLMKINNDECFVKKISASECVKNNLFDANNNEIIIDPIDRIFI
jgi:hypothetical protein